MADEVLQGVSGITNLITTPGLINTDFAIKMIANAGSVMASGRRVATTGPRWRPAIPAR
jgi:cell division GTPase FtsZ